ncbi:MAG: co-chaperone GroES [Acidaminococcaceae bacterium]|nr:co-chaperone GroES [Acidaminococcaceae bacterium]HBX75423.1 co-chaperone GroES [Acidaminococcaceae bacterium]
MLRPLGANVVVKADAVEEKTKSGIFIPDTASKEKPMQGVVLAVGNGAIVEGKRFPVDVKVGDSVIFAKYCGTQIKYEGEELLILAERDILAVVEPDTKKKK